MNATYEDIIATLSNICVIQRKVQGWWYDLCATVYIYNYYYYYYHLDIWVILPHSGPFMPQKILFLFSSIYFK